MKFMQHHLASMTRRNFLSAFMLFAMALCLNLPAEDAFAANRPQWVARKIKAWKLVRNNKVTSAGKPGYYVL